MARKKGSKNRNFPRLTLEEARKVPQAIQDGASGMSVTKLTLAGIMDYSPSSNSFRELLLTSRAYGLTNGGVNADRFELTQLGREITSGDELTVHSAVRKALLNVDPFRAFLTAYDGKKIPSEPALREWLEEQTSVPAEYAEEFITHLMQDAQVANYIRKLKGAQYVELSTEEIEEEFSNPIAEDEPDRQEVIDELGDENGSAEPQLSIRPAGRKSPQRNELPESPSKVFIAHGKNRIPLEEVKKILGQFGVLVAVAVDEPHGGRPISAKVAEIMRHECSSAIFIFTADERFLQEDDSGKHEEVWRPSENVVYELGAASVLYDRRIVILKEKRVSFPSDFSDLGYLEFDQDQIQSQAANLMAELVKLEVIEVRAKR